MSLTPEQFNKLATKKDVEGIKTELKDFKKDFFQDKNEVLNAIDGLAKKFDNFHAELAANQAAHDRFDKTITDLKKRIRNLEKKI